MYTAFFFLLSLLLLLLLFSIVSIGVEFGGGERGNYWENNLCIGRRRDETMVESEIRSGVGLFDLHVSWEAGWGGKNESIERCLHRC